MVIPSEIMD